MCGLAGVVGGGIDPDELKRRVDAMTLALIHRGPDDGGTWVEPGGNVALGHRRLAVLDVSPEGHQPMRSNTGRYVIVFNGEIYNYIELNAELKSQGVVVSGQSDTAVLLAAIETWGIEATLERSWGMFAFAAFDTVNRKLTLARDRLGKKPLYYGYIGAHFAFASELKAFVAVFEQRLDVDREAMGLLARFGFIPEPWSAYRQIKKLEPGQFLTFDVSSTEPSRAFTIHSYYDLNRVIDQGVAAQASPPREEALLAEAQTLLDDAVRVRMRSDVPFGALLSGGIDSSLVVATMQRLSSQRTRTYSIGYESKDYDESQSARAIAKHLDTQHTEFIVSPQDVMGLVDRMCTVYDEPFADSSQLPTCLVASLARREVTVVLTGDGGDELFAGYNRHVWGQRVWKSLNYMPATMRHGLAGLLSQVSPETWRATQERFSPYLPTALRVAQLPLKANKLRKVMGARDFGELHLGLATHWAQEDRVMKHPVSARTRAESARPCGLSDLDHALWFDTIQGLPGDMLVKVDRATMAVGLEARQPLLDHRLLEFAWRVPPQYKIRNGSGKWLLRQLLARSVPRNLFERPKVGFGVPIGEWLKGPLRPWAEDLLSLEALRKFDVFSESVVRRAWKSHLSGVEDHDQRLWIVLMTHSWLRSVSSS